MALQDHDMRGWQQQFTKPALDELLSTLADPDMGATPERVSTVCASFTGMYKKPIARVSRGREVGGHAFLVDKGVVTIFFVFGAQPCVEVFKRGNVKRKSVRELIEDIDRKIFAESRG